MGITTAMGMGASRWTPAATPPRSAAIVAVFAMSRMTTDPIRTFRPNRALITSPSPSSLQAPIRAAIDWTATRRGMVKTAIHNSP